MALADHKKKLQVGGTITALVIGMHSLNSKVDLIESRIQDQKSEMISRVEDKFQQVTIQLDNVGKTQNDMSKRLEVIDQRLYELKKNMISLDEPKNNPNL
jgi:archaellum component FlaC